MHRYKSIEWLEPAAIRLLDQRYLPHEIIYMECRDVDSVVYAIRHMVLRGAPLIGIATAYAIALAAINTESDAVVDIKHEIDNAGELLRASRPTAVNLAWALDEVQRRINKLNPETGSSLKREVLVIAHALAAQDIDTNKRIGISALDVIPAGAVILHHCNTGGLATVDYGTALGVIRTAHEHGRKIHVYVGETRPRLQGAKLTSWELKQLGIPHTVIVDSASGYVMRSSKVDLCVVGCDRVAMNGDTANKIGTYNLAVVAHENNVPFYVAAPLSSIDTNISCGDEIEIEMRDNDEVTHINSKQITPDDVDVLNPAFDITPARYITGFFTEQGIIRPPFDKNLSETRHTDL